MGLHKVPGSASDDVHGRRHLGRPAHSDRATSNSEEVTDEKFQLGVAMAPQGCCSRYRRRPKSGRSRVARQAVKPPIREHVGNHQGHGPCERTYGALSKACHPGQAENGKTINLHLGPAAALAMSLTSRPWVSKSRSVPHGRHAAGRLCGQSLKQGDQGHPLCVMIILCRNWAIAAQGGRGGGPRGWELVVA